MAKPTTIKIRLNSTAGDGALLRHQEERPDDDREVLGAEIRPRGSQARRVPGRQDQVGRPIE